jgi:broad specificity phosphatase PhoE
MNPTVLLVRHGETALNDPKNEAIRGYSDIPLSIDGSKGVKAAAAFLADSGLTIVRILASPLQRTMMTAMTIAEPTKARVIPCNGLLPWNLGDLTGKPVKEVATLMDWYQEFHEIKVTNGESYGNFYNRWSEALDKMLIYAVDNPTEVLVGVVHSRNLLALPSILGDRNIGDVPVKGGPPPESITKIELGEEGWKMSLFWEEPS